jgi:hypothetical protein
MFSFFLDSSPAGKVTKQQFKEFYGAKVVSLLGPIFDRLFDVLGTHTHNPLALCMARPPACLACLEASTRTGSLRQNALLTCRSGR